MCDGSIASAASVALPLGQTLIQATPRSDAGQPAPPAASGGAAPTPPANPNLGRHLDVSA